jgi:P27 family predicted phage terminase small subunit
MPGPMPLPSRILDMRSSHRAEERRRQELHVEPGRPTCPRGLSPRAKGFWRSKVRELDALGILAEIDGPRLARYCHLLDRWWSTKEWVDEHGEDYQTIEYDDGGNAKVTWKLYPKATYLLTIHDRLMKLESEFGMSPAARAKWRTDPTKNAGSNGPKLKLD